jgi:hypothetical protein
MGAGAGPSTSQDTNQQTTAADWEKGAINQWQQQYGTATSNVNATLAAGNPYQTQQYKTNQNLQTSAAAHATNDAATEAGNQAALRTGQNAAAVPAQSAQNARNAQQNIDTYNAARDTSNEQAWQGEKAGLLGEEGTLAGQAGSVAGAAAGATNTADENLTNAQQYNNEDDWKWIKYGTGAAAGAAQAI